MDLTDLWTSILPALGRMPMMLAGLLLSRRFWKFWRLAPLVAEFECEILAEECIICKPCREWITYCTFSAE